MKNIEHEVEVLKRQIKTLNRLFEEYDKYIIYMSSNNKIKNKLKFKKEYNKKLNNK